MTIAKRFPAVFLLALTLFQTVALNFSQCHANVITEQTLSHTGGSVKRSIKPIRMKRASLTSRDFRKERTLQFTFHLMPIFPVVQSGVDLDFFLNEQLSVGLSRNTIMMVLMDYEESMENTSIHFKRYLGNSFYIKPSIGVHTKKESGWMAVAKASNSAAIQVELGNEWFWTKQFGVNLSYLGMGVRYDAKDNEVKQIGLLPSIRLFGAF